MVSLAPEPSQGPIQLRVPSFFQTIPTPRLVQGPRASPTPRAPALQRTDLSGGCDGENEGGNRGAAQVEKTALGDSRRSLQRAEPAPKAKPNQVSRQDPPLPPPWGRGQPQQ